MSSSVLIQSALPPVSLAVSSIASPPIQMSAKRGFRVSPDLPHTLSNRDRLVFLQAQTHCGDRSSRALSNFHRSSSIKQSGFVRPPCAPWGECRVRPTSPALPWIQHGHRRFRFRVSPSWGFAKRLGLQALGGLAVLRRGAVNSHHHYVWRIEPWCRGAPLAIRLNTSPCRTTWSFNGRSCCLRCLKNWLPPTETFTILRVHNGSLSFARQQSCGPMAISVAPRPCRSTILQPVQGSLWGYTAHRKEKIRTRLAESSSIMIDELSLADELTDQSCATIDKSQIDRLDRREGRRDSSSTDGIGPENTPSTSTNGFCSALDGISFILIATSAYLIIESLHTSVLYDCGSSKPPEKQMYISSEVPSSSDDSVIDVPFQPSNVSLKHINGSMVLEVQWASTILPLRSCWGAWWPRFTSTIDWQGSSSGQVRPGIGIKDKRGRPARRGRRTWHHSLEFASQQHPAGGLVFKLSNVRP